MFPICVGSAVEPGRSRGTADEAVGPITVVRWVAPAAGARCPSAGRRRCWQTQSARNTHSCAALPSRQLRSTLASSGIACEARHACVGRTVPPHDVGGWPRQGKQKLCLYGCVYPQVCRAECYLHCEIARTCLGQATRSALERVARKCGGARTLAARRRLPITVVEVRMRHCMYRGCSGSLGTPCISVLLSVVACMIGYECASW